MNISTFINNCSRKILHLFLRIWDWLRLFPIRLFRIFKHLSKGLLYFSPQKTAWKMQWSHLKPWTVFAHWLIDLFFYFIDLLGIGDFYETILDICKFNSRPMSDEEITLAKLVFGDTINYKRILIDEYAFAGPKQKHFAYVSFYTINSWGKMSADLLLHELTHVWQYQKMGAVYIPRALRAQQSQYGYNYGGLKKLKEIIEKKGNIYDFNLEQQGDIVLDYFRLKMGDYPRWGLATVNDIGAYEYFIKDIRTEEKTSIV